MKKILLFVSIILSSFGLAAQDNTISVGGNVGCYAVSYSRTPVYMPRVGTFSVYVANNFKRFRYDTGLKLYLDHFTLEEKKQTGESYKSTFDATLASLYCDVAFKLVSKKSHQSDLQLGVALVKCYDAMVRQQYTDLIKSYNLQFNRNNLAVCCGYRISFPIVGHWVINVTPNVNYKIFDVNALYHGNNYHEYHYYPNFRFFYGIDIGVEYFFKIDN